MHRLLKRQLKKARLSEAMLNDRYQRLIELVDATYNDSDIDRKLLENSLSISSQEMQNLYERLEKHSLAQIKSSEAKYSRLVKNMQKHYFFYIHDLCGNFSYLSDSVKDILGFSKNEFIAQKDNFPSREMIRCGKKSDKNKIKETDLSEPYEILTYHKNGQSLYLEITEYPIFSDSGEVDMIEGIVRDVSRRHAAQNKIEHIAHHDNLTGLSNRLDLDEKLNDILKISKRSDLKFALMFLDLDHFKRINDTLGHDVGDQLLKEIATRISPNIRGDDIFARIGGDEFIIVLSNLSEDNLTQTVNKVMKLIRQAWNVNNLHLEISTSIGIAVYPQDGKTKTELMKNADIAMYRAKELGRDNFCFFTEELNVSVHKEMKLEQDMAKALHTEQFSLYLQPIVKTSNNELVGAEALIRWNHPDLGLIPPNEFIPLAENTGFILKLGDWVIQKACEIVNTISKQSKRKLFLSINISTRQFQHGDLVKTTRNAIKESGIDPTCLVYEITESIVVDNMDKLVEKLHHLKKIGLTISMDDFGTGYSSLSSISNMPIDTLKIDKAFVDKVVQNSNQTPLLDAIIVMGSTLGKKVIAEGVEKEFQRKYLGQHQCPFYQGYLYSKPLTETQYLTLLNDSENEKINN